MVITNLTAMAVDVKRVTTTDPEVAHRTINEMFLADRPARFSRPAGRADFALVSQRTDDLLTGRVRHTLPAYTDTQPFVDLYTAVMLRGGLRWQVGRDTVDQRSGDVVCYPTGVPVRARWDEMDVVLLSLPMEAVYRTAEDYTGVARHRFRFEAMSPLSAAAAQQWRQLTSYVYGTMSGGAAALTSPLVRHRLVELTAATALSVFPNPTLAVDPPRGSAAAVTSALQRAIVFIDTHAPEPIRLADVAAAARVTPRALQFAFRRHYGITPMGYLRRVRLDGAHRDLRAGDPTRGDTVAAIAATWGFADPTRFAALYREQFDQLPSRTLRS